MKLLIIIVIAILISNAMVKHQEASKKAFIEMLKESRGNRIFYGITFSIAALFGTFIILGTNIISWIFYIFIQLYIIQYMKDIGENK